MDEFLVKMRLLLKAEMILFRLQLRRTVRQAAFYIAAVLLAVLAVGMLNIAFYLYLAPRLDNSGAALAVAFIDILLAVVAVVAAGKLHLGPEADSVMALREATMDKLTTDAERVKAQITDLHDDIKQIRTAVTGFLSFGGVNLASLFQWVPVLLRVLLRRKDP
jgi:outer membrane murein-binding lipoprotein Lpp